MIGFVNLVISVIPVVLRKNTLTISDSTGEPVSMESEILRVIFFIKTEISERKRLKIRSSGSGYFKAEVQ